MTTLRISSPLHRANLSKINSTHYNSHYSLTYNKQHECKVNLHGVFSKKAREPWGDIDLPTNIITSFPPQGPHTFLRTSHEDEEMNLLLVKLANNCNKRPKITTPFPSPRENIIYFHPFNHTSSSINILHLFQARRASFTLGISPTAKFRLQHFLSLFNPASTQARLLSS